jgi:hypothetical protein
MNDAWILVSAIAIWIALQHVVLPRLGVPT